MKVSDHRRLRLHRRTADRAAHPERGHGGREPRPAAAGVPRPRTRFVQMDIRDRGMRSLSRRSGPDASSTSPSC
jgi:hypothetical protein